MGLLELVKRFFYTPKRDLVKQVASMTLVGTASYLLTNSLLFTSSLVFQTGFYYYLRGVTADAWKQFTNEKGIRKPVQKERLSVVGLFAAAGMGTYMYFGKDVLQETKDMLPFFVDSYLGKVNTEFYPVDEIRKEVWKNSLQTAMKLLYAYRLGDMLYYFLLDDKLKMFLRPRTSFLASYSSDPLQRKKFSAKLSGEQSFFAYDYLEGAKQAGQYSDGLAFLFEQYYLSTKRRTLPLNQTRRYLMFQDKVKNSPPLEQLAASLFFDVEHVYTEYLFEQSLEQARKKNNLEELALLCLYKEKNNPVVAEDLWGELTKRSLKAKNVEERVFEKATHEILVPSIKGEEKNTLRLAILNKIAPSSQKDRLLEEIALTEELRTRTQQNPHILFPLYTHFHVDEKNERAIASVLRYHLPTLAQVAKNYPKLAQVLYGFAAKFIPVLGDALEEQTLVQMDTLDMHEKYLSSTAALLEHPDYDVGLVEESVSIVRTLGASYMRPLLDYHYHNLLTPQPHVRRFVIDESFIMKLDTENKGCGPLMLEYVNLFHHSFDVLSFYLIRHLMGDIYGPYMDAAQLTRQEVISLEMACLDLRVHGFLKAWSKPGRAVDAARRNGQALHAQQVFSDYKDEVLPELKTYMKRQEEQMGFLSKAEHLLDKRWG